MAWLTMWFGLPHVAPEWVVEHSPWVEPIVRAQADKSMRSDGIVAYYRRLDEWSSAAFPALERLLRANDPWVRVYAANAVRHIQHETQGRLPASLTGQLVQLLRGDEQEEARIWAASALAGTDVPSARQALLAATEDESAAVQQSAFESLGGVNDPAIITRRLAVLNSPFRSLRVAALQGLGTPDDASQVAPLMRVVAEKDLEFEVLFGAFDALRRSRTPAAFTALSAIVAGDQRQRVVRLAMDALNEGAWPADLHAEAPLLVALDRPEPGVRAVAARLLGLLSVQGDDRLRDLLVTRLDDREPWVRGEVALTLAMCFRDPVVVEELISRFEDGRLPAPPMGEREKAEGLIAYSASEDQIDAVIKLRLTPNQRERLERVRRRLDADHAGPPK